MATRDRRVEPDAHVIAAARAAAGWARSRRATWTDEPLPAPAWGVEATPAIAPPPERHDRWSDLTAAMERLRSGAPAIGRWFAIGAVAGALAVTAWLSAPRLRRATPRRTSPSTSLLPESAPPRRPDAAPPPAPTRAPAGELHVKSTPAGARVLLDGKDRGITPLTLTDVSTGAHDITLTSSAGTVHRSVRVVANQSVDVDEPIFSGWVAVLAPFDVDATENGRALRTDDRNEILLPPGVHDIRLANATLNYAIVEHVEVKPGATATLRVTPPPSTLTITAAEPAEIWLDGTRIGETPLTGFPAALGVHEIVVRRAAAGERRFTVTVGTKPVTLNLDAPR